MLTPNDLTNGIPRNRRVLYGCLLGLIWVMNLIDSSLTLHWIGQGIATELNPLMRLLIALSPLAFVIGKLSAGTSAVCLFWVSRESPPGRALAAGVGLIYAGVGIVHGSFVLILT